MLLKIINKSPYKILIYIIIGIVILSILGTTIYFLFFNKNKKLICPDGIDPCKNGTICCPKGMKCYKDTCCETSKICGDKCCENECAGNTCCTNTQPLNYMGECCDAAHSCGTGCCTNVCCEVDGQNICCPPGTTCFNGKCCPSTKACGATGCCDNGCCGDICCSTGTTCIGSSCCATENACYGKYCCTGSEKCMQLKETSYNICCPSDRQATGGTCCPEGQTVINGVCCSSKKICDNQCCPYDCCGTGTTSMCCTEDTPYCRESDHTCQATCGNVGVCPEDTPLCYIGHCCATGRGCGTQDGCCPNDCCNGQCCDTGTSCYYNTCCSTDKQCGNSCCETLCCKGTCCPQDNVCTENDGCCPSNRVCGSKCCPEGQTCHNGVCCNDQYACGNTCCTTPCCNGECCDHDQTCHGQGQNAKCMVPCGATGGVTEYCDPDTQTCIHTTDITGKELWSCKNNNGCRWGSIEYDPGDMKRDKAISATGCDGPYDLQICSNDDGKLIYCNNPSGVEGPYSRSVTTNIDQSLSKCTAGNCYDRINECGLELVSYDNQTCKGNFDCKQELPNCDGTCPYDGDKAAQCCLDTITGKYTGQICPTGQICFDSNGEKICGYGWKPNIDGNPYCDPETESASGIKYFTEKECMTSPDMYPCTSTDGIDQKYVQGALLFCGGNMGQKCYNPSTKTCENSRWPYSIKLDNDIIDFGQVNSQVTWVGDKWNNIQKINVNGNSIPSARCPKGNIYLASMDSNTKYCVSDTSKIPLPADAFLRYDRWH